MPKKIGRDVLKKKPVLTKGKGVYERYYSPEFRDIVRYIQTKLGKKVYLIGLRAMYERGVPAYRLTEDFDIYTPMSKAERDTVIAYVRKKYERSREVWRDFGFGLDFYPIGKLHHVDVNVISPHIFDESWEEVTVEVNGVKVFLPPLEDLLILKLLSPRRKDRRDVGVALRLAGDKIDFAKLMAKAKKVGVEKKLIRTAKRFEVKI